MHCVSSVQGVFWKKIIPEGPGARSFGCASYVPESAGILVHGGSFGQNIYDDTWLYTDGAWELLIPETTRPQPRFGSATVTYLGNSITLLFGGSRGRGDYFDDTWIWTNGDWTRLDLSGPPTPRAFHSLSLDVLNQRIVLFGGVNDQGVVLPKTWEYDGDHWEMAHEGTGAPAARFGHAMTYDFQNTVTVLFGGELGDTTLSNETWTWNGADWNPVTPVDSPSPRMMTAMCYYPEYNGVLLFGGNDENSSVDDTWLWNGTNWIELNPVHAPSPRRGHTMDYDATTQKMMLFGGASDELWSFYDNDWHQEPNPVTRPLPRANPVFVYDADAGNAVLFGGMKSNPSNQVYYEDTWIFTGDGWLFVDTPGGNPLGRSGAFYSMNRTTDNLVVFGGNNTFSGPMNDTWTFRDSLWTPLSPANSPPVMYHGAMEYDPVNDGLILYGGNTELGLTGDMYFWNGSNWLPITPETSPGPRWLHAMAYDPDRNGIWMFGGADDLGYLEGLWFWDGIDWNLIEDPPGSAPMGRIGHSLAYSAFVQRLILFGGYIGQDPGFYFNDSWTFDGSEWQLLTGLKINPSCRAFHEFVSVDQAGALILFGGQNSSYSDNAETWILGQVNPPTLTPTPTPEHTMPPSTFTPTETPTPTPGPPSGVNLILNRNFFLPHDPFLLQATLSNAESSIRHVDYYVLLDVYGIYFYYPEWTENPGFESRNLEPGLTEHMVLEFEWPETDSAAEDIIFWAALLDSGTADLFGEFDYVTFGYGVPGGTPTPTPSYTPTSPVDPTFTPSPEETSTPSPTSPPPDPEITYETGDYQLTGEGCEAADIFCFEESLYFESCSDFLPVIQIYNPGQDTVTVFCNIEGTHSYVFEMDNSSQFGVSPSGTQEVRIRFCPNAPPGDREAILTISTDDRIIGSCLLKSQVVG